MGEEWLSFEWPGYHLYQAIAAMKAWQNDFTSFGCPLSKVVVTYSKGTTSFYVIKKEYEDSGERLFNKTKKDPKILFKVLRDINRAANEIFKLGIKWKDVGFSALTDKQLLKYHKELFRWDEQLWKKGQIPNLLEFHNNYLTKYVKELIVEKFGRNKELEYFGILSTSHYVSRQEKQDDDFVELVNIVKKVSKDSHLFKKLLKRHWQNYTWMIYGWAGPSLNYDYFLNNALEGMKKPKNLPDLKKKKLEKSSLFKKQKIILNKFTVNDKKLVLLLRKLLEAKAIRVDAHSLTYFLADQIRGEIAKRVFLSINQMRVISPDNTYKIFNKLDINKINEEYDFVIYWFERSKGLIKLSGRRGREKFKYIALRLPKIKATNKIEGELAYPGKVRGKVKVILSAEQFKGFKKGQILVTRITDPGYIPIIKIAKAIITDIGGITCHAAIVSRELKIPCVIGTKIATKVLRDGDRVEVDAEKGVVKII